MLEWWQSGNSFPSALTPSGPSTHFHHASDNRLLCRGSSSFRQNFTLNLLTLTLILNSRQGFAKRRWQRNKGQEKKWAHSKHLPLHHVHLYLSDLKSPCSEILSPIRYIPQVIINHCVASSAYRPPCGYACQGLNSIFVCVIYVTTTFPIVKILAIQVYFQVFIKLHHEVPVSSREHLWWGQQHQSLASPDSFSSLKTGEKKWWLIKHDLGRLLLKDCCHNLSNNTNNVWLAIDGLLLNILLITQWTVMTCSSGIKGLQTRHAYIFWCSFIFMRFDSRSYCTTISNVTVFNMNSFVMYVCMYDFCAIHSACTLFQWMVCGRRKWSAVAAESRGRSCCRVGQDQETWTM